MGGPDYAVPTNSRSPSSFCWARVTVRLLTVRRLRHGSPFTPTSVVVGDFNGDGKQDLAVLSAAGTGLGVNIYLGNGDGTFQTA